MSGQVVITPPSNPVPPGSSIGGQITPTTGTLISVGDDIEITLTLPAGITVPKSSQTALNFQVTQSGVPFNVYFAVASTVVPATFSITWTWSNLTTGAAAVVGAPFNLVVGFSTQAILQYTATPVVPVTLARLLAAMAAVSLNHSAIEQKTGSVQTFDATTNPSGNIVKRTLAYALPYSCFASISGAVPLPSNTNTRQFFVVTTAGAYAADGNLVYDNGSSTGTTVLVPITVNLMIVTAGPTSSFTGTDFSLIGNHFYTWNGAAWVDGGVTNIGRSAFQNNFPLEDGAQATAFNNLYTATFAGALGGTVSSMNVLPE